MGTPKKSQSNNPVSASPPIQGGLCDKTLERAAQACEQEAQDFLSPEYATGQPESSNSERFACNECARAIRALKGKEPAPETQGGEADADRAFIEWRDRRSVWPRVFVDEAFKAGWDAALKGKEPAPETGGWRPIETYRKDLSDKVMLGIVRSGKLEEVHIGGWSEAWNDDEISCWWSDQADDEICPSVWMSLPGSVEPAPETSRQSDDDLLEALKQARADIHKLFDIHPATYDRIEQIKTLNRIDAAIARHEQEARVQHGGESR